MASEAVLKYLEDTNRPYSCGDVTVNLRGAYTKSAVQKALDALSKAGKIKCKIYGKQKVYAAIQHDNTDVPGDNEDYDEKFKHLTKETEVRRAELKTMEIRLKTVSSTPTTAAAETRIDEMRANIIKIDNKLETLRNSVAVISVEEKMSILNARETYLREYRKRKRICTDMMETVLDAYPKSKKSFLDDLCIETDEIAGFKLTT